MVEHNVRNMFVIVILNGRGFYAAPEGDILDSFIKKSPGCFNGIMAVLNHRYGTKTIRYLLHQVLADTDLGSGIIFIWMNSSTTEKIPSYESTKPKKPYFFAFAALKSNIS